MRAFSSLIAITLLAGCASSSPPPVATTVPVAQAPVAQAPVAQAPMPPVAQAPMPPVAGGPAAPVPIVTGSSVTGPIDGIYHGVVSLVSTETDKCPRDARGVIEIGDHLLQYAYSPDEIFVVRIPPDGRLHAENGTLKLDGQLVDGDLTVVVTDPACKSELAFRRVSYF